MTHKGREDCRARPSSERLANGVKCVRSSFTGIYAAGTKADKRLQKPDRNGKSEPFSRRPRARCAAGVGKMEFCVKRSPGVLAPQLD